jgi:hypothetical protein
MAENRDNTVVSLRLKGADAARYWRIMDAAKHRNPYIDKSDVIRELVGLDPPKLLTAQEIEHFRHGGVGIMVAPKSKGGVPLMNHNVETRKRKVRK